MYLLFSCLSYNGNLRALLQTAQLWLEFTSIFTIQTAEQDKFFHEKSS